MKTALIAIMAVVAIAAGNFVLYTVDEAEQAIIVQFGEPIGGVISEPGLKFKLPWQNVRYFDKRLLVWDGDVTQIPTLGREFILVDTTARWRIADPLLFLTSVRDEAGARTRLDDIVDSVVRDMVSSTELEEIVRSKDWSVDVEELDPALAERGDVDLEMQPSLGRELLEEEILTRARSARCRRWASSSTTSDQAGQLHQLGAPAGRKPHDRRAPVDRRAVQIRRHGPQPGDSRQHGARSRRIRSEAAREAEEIRGNADAEATRIYGEAYRCRPGVLLVLPDPGKLPRAGAEQHPHAECRFGLLPLPGRIPGAVTRTCRLAPPG